MEKSRLFTKQALLTGLASMSILALVACGGTKTNPVEDYPDLQGWGQQTNEKPRTQSILPSEIYQIETEKYLNFVEGRTESYYFKPRLLMSGVEYQLAPKGLPEGASFTLATEPEHAGEYVLTWTPKVGTLVDAKPATFEFQLETQVLKVSDQRAADIMQQIGHPRVFKLSLSPIDEQPVVEKADLESKSIQQGEAKTFTVIVKDLGSWSANPPMLFAKADVGVTQTNGKIDGVSCVRITQKPQDLGNGRWQFTGTFDTRGLELPKNQKEVLARFVLMVVSPSRLVSPDQVVEVRVNRAPEAAAPASAEPKATQPQSNGDKK